MCCKLAWTSIFDIKGRKYKRRSVGASSLPLRSGNQMIRKFYFSHLFSLENILDGKDYNGKRGKCCQGARLCFHEEFDDAPTDWFASRQADELVQDKAECSSVEVVAHAATRPPWMGSTSASQCHCTCKETSS